MRISTYFSISQIRPIFNFHLTRLTIVMSISIEIRENEQYASVDYWNNRYTSESEYDWLGDYAVFKDLIHKHVKKSDQILMVGCGNSQLSQQMFEDGYAQIVSTDISEVCIENQAKTFPHLPWQVADITSLPFADKSFDIVIEKATLDALLVGEKSPWQPSDEGQEIMDKSLSEISRVLKKQGRFLSLTFAQPHFRSPFYAQEKYDWSVDHETFGSGFHYFCFIMTKGRPLQGQVTIASEVSKLTLNVNENYSSSDEGEDFTSRLDLSFESSEHTSGPSSFASMEDESKKTT